MERVKRKGRGREKDKGRGEDYGEKVDEEEG